MRSWPIMFALTFLIACGPPHPTHPTRVNCPLTVETRFGALIDMSLGTIQEGQDPCLGGVGGAIFTEWTQRDRTEVSVCVAAGTTPEQAASLCSRHLEATGQSVGQTTNVPVAPRPPTGGRICPGSERVMSLIVSTADTPSLFPDQCREGTTWPLLP